jgi:hypothetical protein
MYYASVGPFKLKCMCSGIFIDVSLIIAVPSMYNIRISWVDPMTVW